MTSFAAAFVISVLITLKSGVSFCSVSVVLFTICVNTACTHTMQRANASEIATKMLLIMKWPAYRYIARLALQDIQKWMGFSSTSLLGQAPYPCKRCSDAALRVTADKYFRCHLQWWNSVDCSPQSEDWMHEYRERSIKRKGIVWLRETKEREREREKSINECLKNLSNPKSKEEIKLCKCSLFLKV